MDSGANFGSTKIVILGELEFPHLMSPCSEGFYKGKYSASIKIPKTGDPAIHKIKEAIEEASVAKWGGVVTGLISPLKDGDECSSANSVFENCFYLNARNSNKPYVVDRRKRVISEAREIAYGSVCKFALEFKAYNMDGKRGVACYLIGVQLVKPAEQSNNADLFDDLGDDEDEDEYGSGNTVPVLDEDDDDKGLDRFGNYNRPRNY